MKYFFFILCLFSCANQIDKAVRKAKYSAWETIGVEKRDLFKREISNVKDNQKESGESLKDALTQLKEVYGFDGGNLEREYNKLNASYVDAKNDGEKVNESIVKLDNVANDLFEEWNNEISQIKTHELKSKSRDELSETKKRYRELQAHLKVTESKLSPLLSKLNDQVLFLKHNLNAKAISGLKSEGQRIEADTTKLMEEIEASNKEAEAFIKEL
jgi:predicted  nucleic acid-binding Zn-ribbon protein